MNTNLQQQNFKEIQQRMVAAPGWEILEANGILALKSPVATPLNHMVWGELNDENLFKVINFYEGQEFFWLLTPVQARSIPDSLKEMFAPQDEASIFPEMVFDLSEYHGHDRPKHITVFTPKSDTDLQVWTDTAIETLRIDENDFKAFFYPSIHIGQCIPLLQLYNNEPAGTAMVYCGHSEAGIYAMSTREKFRRKGIGSVGVYACLDIAKQKSLKQAVLYASAMGAYLYTALGFKAASLWHELHYKKKQRG